MFGNGKYVITEPGRAGLVAIVEVVDVGRVEIDRLLDPRWPSFLVKNSLFWRASLAIEVNVMQGP